MSKSNSIKIARRLRAIINIFIQVIFPNIITYSDRTFEEEQNDLNSKIK